MIVPTRRLVTLAFACAAVALAAGIARVDARPLLIIDVLVLVACAVDAASAVRRRLTIEREAPQIFSVGRPNLVTLTVRSSSDRPVRGTVADDPLEACEPCDLPARITVAPRGTCTVRYEVTPLRRGPRAFGAVTVRYLMPLGLFWRQERHELPRDVDVYPDVHAARALELLRRQGRQDARLGSLRVRGGDTEFERLRPYVRGDEVRHVDWRASARKDEIVVRQFQAESNQNVVFAVDLGRSMRGESAGIGAVDRALAAALLAADVAVRGGDKAGLFTFDDRPRSLLRPTGGRAGARKLTRAAYALEAGLAATDYRAAMVFLKAQVKARSLFVIFTQVLEPRAARELAGAVRALVPRHLPLCVLMRDDAVEELALGPADDDGEDAFGRAAAASALSWRAGTVRALERAGALVLDARPADVTPELVKRFLEIKARRLL